MGLDTVELVMDVEERFGVRFSDAELGRCRTVADLSGLVRERIHARREHRSRLERARRDVRAEIAGVTGQNDRAVSVRRPLVGSLGLEHRVRFPERLSRRGPALASSGCIALQGQGCFALLARTTPRGRWPFRKSHAMLYGSGGAFGLD